MVLLGAMLCCVFGPALSPFAGSVDAHADERDGQVEGFALRSVTDRGTYAAAELRSYVEPDVVVENGYALRFVRFRSGGFEAGATIALPTSPPPPGGFGVVVNGPGTVGLDDPCAVSASVAGAGLAGTFGARGLIGVAIDYPGLGTPGTHPYLVSEAEAAAIFGGARAALRVARSLGIPTSQRVAIVGVSQGGHAALAAAARAAAAPDLQIVGVAAVAPAGAFLEHWRTSIGEPGPHLVYHALLTYAWQRHYGSDGACVFAPALAALADDVFTTACILGPPGRALGDRLGTDPKAIFCAGYLADFASGDLASYPAIARGFRENRVRAFRQTAPLRIYQGTDDAVVPRRWTDAVVAELRAGGVEVDYVIVPDGAHTDIAFGPLAAPQRRTEDALAWLRARLRR